MGKIGIGINLEFVRHEDKSFEWGVNKAAELGYEYVEPMLHWGRELLSEAGYFHSVSMLDDPRETLGAALHYLGLDPNTTDESELQQAADLVAQAREWTAAYDSGTYQDNLVSGEVVVAHGYSGNFLEAFDGLEGFAYLVPEEGATVWTDAMAILADAPHPCTAHTFIDFVLRAERGAALTEYIYYPSPNAAAEALIDTEILEDPAVYPSAATQARLRFLQDTGDFETRFTDLFLQATS